MMLKVSHGELIDKYTILLIKTQYVIDKNKRNHILYEKSILEPMVHNLRTQFTNLSEYIDQLFDVNMKLWNIEDAIRQKEKSKIFDAEFIQLARDVYYTNDIRAEIKAEINLLTNSSIHEVKQYINYL